MKHDTYHLDTDAVRRAFERRGLPFEEVRRQSKLLSITLRRLLDPNEKPPDMTKARAVRAMSYTIYQLARALRCDPRELAPDVPMPPPGKKIQEELPQYFNPHDKPNNPLVKRHWERKRSRAEQRLEESA